MIEILITETSRNSLKEKPYRFNVIIERFQNREQFKLFLQERYSKIPRGKNKIYYETKDGKTIECGITHSFWNKDISHNSNNWYQTDWIEIKEVSESPLSYKEALTKLYFDKEKGLIL